MKHIDIIPNYSGITGLIADGEISPNFLVKSSNDGKVHFSNAMGYQVVVDSGETLNMYKEPGTSGTNNVYVPFTSAQGFGFIILKDGVPITADFDYSAIQYMSDGSQDTRTGSETGVTHFTFYWEWSDVSWEVRYSPSENLVQVVGFYYMTDEETCVYKGGEWDEETQSCKMPCASQGLCDDPDNPGECIPCEEPTCEDACQGDPECECLCWGPGWYWNPDTQTCEQNSEPDPCVEDPECCGDLECGCNQDDYSWWDGESCHSCLNEWEDLGYSSAEECACEHRGNFCDSGGGESGGETSDE